MFRSQDDAPKKNSFPVNCLIAELGIGDLLCSLVAVDYILNKAPWVNLLVWVPNPLKEFAKHVLPKHTTIRNFTEAKNKYDESKFGVTTKLMGQMTPMRMHPVKYAFHVLADYSPTIEEMSYLKIRPDEIDISKFNLPEKYVVLPAASTEPVKTMPVETMNKTIDYVISKGYTPVFLGKTENFTGYTGMSFRAEAQDYDFSKGINLLDKTSLLESAAIIAKSKLFIGMDSGLAHLGGFTETNLIIGYTFVKPDVMVPVRDGILGKGVFPIEPDESLGCRGCQSKWTLMFEHDFRDCKYEDFLCASQITFDKIKKTIEDNKLL